MQKIVIALLSAVLFSLFTLSANGTPLAFEYDRVLALGSEATIPDSIPLNSAEPPRFNVLGRPSINNSGNLVFGASVFAANRSIPALYSMSASGSQTLVALNGQPSTQSFGGAYDFGPTGPSASIANNNQIAFVGDESGGNEALWSVGDTGVVKKLVQERQSLPGINQTITRFQSNQNDNGNILLKTYYGAASATQDTGLWSMDADTGDARLIVHGAGENLFFINPVMDASGDVFFTAKKHSFFGTARDVIYSWDTSTGALTELLNTNQNSITGSGPDADNYFISLSSLQVNDAGDMIFLGDIRDKTTLERKSAVWRSDGLGGYEAVAFAGDAVSGLTASSKIDQFLGGKFLLSNDGVSYIKAIVDGQFTLLSVDGGGGVRSMAQVGGAAPGMSNGEKITQIYDYSINANGELLIEVRTIDDNGNTNSVVYFSDGTQLVPVLYRDILLELVNAEQLNLLNFDYRIGSGFNDLGQVAFYGSSLNGASGLFVVTLLHDNVSEPDTVILLVIGVFLIGSGRLGREENRVRWRA